MKSWSHQVCGNKKELASAALMLNPQSVDNFKTEKSDVDL